MKRGRRLYECRDCKARTWFHWVELNRAARIRCGGCGSAAVEPVTAEAKEERLIGNTNVLEARERDKGDVVPDYRLRENVLAARRRESKSP